MTLISMTSRRETTRNKRLVPIHLQQENGGPVDGESKRQSCIARLLFLVPVLALVAFVTHGQSDRVGTLVSQSPVDRRVEDILSHMSLEEKIDLIGGINGFFVRGMTSFGFSPLRMADGPLGVRNGGPATAMPAGIDIAATWDVALATRVGEQIGRDARAKGVNFLLGQASTSIAHR
jgi:hypothetical protein